MLRWVKDHRRSAAAGGLVTAVSVALGVIAITHEGLTSTDVELNDGGVWVTKQETQQLGRINVQAAELDAGLISPTARFDVLQDGEHVMLHNEESSSLVIVDPQQVTTGTAVQLPPQAEVALGGGVVAILEPSDGLLWAMAAGDVGGFSPEHTDPLAELGPDAAVAVGRDGTVHAVGSEEGRQVEIPLEDEGLGEASVRERSELRELEEPVVSAVGEDAVVIDGAGEQLLLPGGLVEVPEGSAVQLPGDASDRVALSAPGALVRQPLRGGDAEVVERPDGGEAVRPVQLGGCTYGVWPGAASFLRDCGADDPRTLDTLVDGMDGSPVVFRINRDQVVLNQYVEGSSWLLADTLILVDNWDDLLPEQSEERSEEQEEESTEDLLTNQPPPPNQENTPPTANDDDFGARAGGATVLPVLWNDTDPDGDVLTASVTGELPQGVSVAPIANDSQLQLELPPDFAAGSFSFGYEIRDGRGGEDSASVRVTVRGQGENSAPRQLRDQRFAVEQGGEFEFQALADWLDPDGDDLYLMGATSDSGDTIQTDPSGRLVYTATGDVGIQTVTITVSDGVAEASGEVTVDIRERGTVPPIPNADFVTTIEGREATVRPLLNDYSPSGRPLRLASVEPAPGLTTEVDLAAGTVRIVGGAVGTYYLTYLVAEGQHSPQGRIRVDVRTADEDARPVAVRDISLLPQGGTSLVDLLANDVDPAGGVLVVTSIQVESAAPITVELRDRRLVSIVDTTLSEPFQFTYSVSNGRFTETGTVQVIPVAPPAQPRAPKAVDDEAIVRAGDYQTIHVTRNDFSPDGTPFELTRVVETSFASEEEGVAFISEGKLRVHARVEAPTRGTVTYEICDLQRNCDSATVALTIVPREAEQNGAPMPGTVTSRVLAGATVRIPIPLDGIDPDGDGVELVGYDDAPDGGRILPEVGPDYFDFEAFPDSAGAVEFTYRVRDRWGAEGTATVLIGIAQAADVNQTPFAQTDLVTVRPSRAVAIPVLENDSDPDQDALSLVQDGLELPDELAGAEVNTERSTVDLESPAEPGDYQFTYTIVDARGARATGTVVMTVAEDAEPQPPVARDDPLPRDLVELDVPLDVPVLDNDLDPDGDPSELEVSVVTGAGRVTAGSAVQVVPSEEFQVVTYRVTDIDGLTAEAFVAVPPVRDRAPFLASTEPLQVPSGELRQIPLRDFVSVSGSGTPRLTSGDRVTAVNDDDSGLVVDAQTLQFRSPLGYVGPASITFEVTDGSGPEDGNIAMLTMPIDVVPSSAVPPTFAGAILRPEAGEDAATFDLRDATRDPDPGDLEEMRYELVGGSMNGVEIGLDGSTFRARADVTTPPGTSGSFQIEAIDPAGNRAPGTVVVEVVATNRPLATVRDDAAEGVQGISQTVDVLSNDVNPFTERGPLRIVSAERVAGAGDVSTDGSTVTLTPGADFSGVLTIRYTVQDATELTSRHVSGTLTVNVKGRPEAPPRPNVDAVDDSQVTLTWGAPASNGAPITGYTVRAVGGGVSQPCASTTCTITGLTNNTTYRFEVIATNEVGDSDPSPPSNEARPDVRPGQPAPPTVERGDTQVTLAWTPPENRGSPIQQYTVEISPPAPGGVVQQQTAATSLTWTGLQNGTAYTFRIQAVNLAPEPSDFSAYSQAVTPAGPPTQVQEVRSTPNRSIPGEVQIQVSWTAPNPNGAAIQTYTVTPSSGSPVTVSGTTANFTFAATGENVTFTVTATNDAGTSQPSAPSAPVRVYTAPDAPSGVRATDGNGDSVVTWTPGSTNGLRAEEVRFEIQGGGAGVQSFGPGGTYTGINNNGGPYTFQVRAVAVVDGTTYASGWTSAGDAVRPYGAIGAPQVTATGEVGQVRFQWTIPARNGRDITMAIQINGGAWENVGGATSRTVSGNPDQTISIVVRASTGAAEAGHGAQTTTGSGQATVKGQPRVWLAKGSVVRASEDCTGANGTQCRYYQINWENLQTGSYSFTCYHSSEHDGTPQFESGTITVSSANGRTETRSNGNHTCYSGYAGDAWVTLSGPSGNFTTDRVAWP